MDYKALAHLSGGSCMCITGICMHEIEGSAAHWGGGGRAEWKSNFHSLLETLPQITWEKMRNFLLRV